MYIFVSYIYWYQRCKIWLLVKVFKLLYQTPGPGTYNVSSSDGYKKKAPVYSLGSRYLLPGDNTHKPGPGSHCPEKVGVGSNQLHDPFLPDLSLYPLK